MPDIDPVSELDAIPSSPTISEGHEPATPPETGGDDPQEVEVDLGEQARRDAERDREIREKYGDQEY